ncbi:MAG: elongation factor G [Desulfohalobiaceae bacterium]|nr:elongation factor G [Desulfohalobiaceae bacterium]
MEKELQGQRTFILVGGSGAGKTSLAEAMLYHTGVSSRMGSIDSGNTFLDFEPEEVKKGGSIQPAYTVFSHKGQRHFLIDVPGDTNFHGELPYQLAAADGAVYVLDAVDGIKPQDKKIWREVRESRLPMLAVINKLDRERADTDQVLNGMRDTLGAKPVPCYLPLGEAGDFQGVVDVLTGTAYSFDAENNLVTSGEVPEGMQDTVREMYETAVENIAESDEELMEKYLEEGELGAEEVQSGLRKGVLSEELIPVCPTAALEGKGAGLLLDMIQNLLPSPLERPSWPGAEGDERPSSPEAPVSCFVFKTIVTPFGGHLNVLRVMSGSVASDMQVYNPQKQVREKLGQLQWVVGKKQEPCKEEVGPGALVAVAKLKNTATGEVLCSEKEPFIYARPQLPSQVLSYALLGSKEDEDKMMMAVHKLLEEDVSLKLHHNEETGDILLSGMGQQHIEMAVEKVKRRNKVDARLQDPKIPYKETLKAGADAQGRFKKQTGGRGQFGDCVIRIEPQQRGEGYEFVNQIVGGVIPKQYIPAVDQGIQEAAQKGILAGYPVVDFKVTCYDGSYHSVDSSEMAFKVAGSMAFKKAAEKAGLTLLEPIMTLYIEVPDEFMGDVIGDISSRRGKVLGYETNQGITEIRAQAPMAEILQYAPDLRAMTGGQGVFSMQFDHYEECPPHVQEAILEQVREKAE